MQPSFLHNLQTSEKPELTSGRHVHANTHTYVSPPRITHKMSMWYTFKIHRWRLVSSTLTKPKIYTGICIYANACVFLKYYNKMESLEDAINTQTLTFGNFILAPSSHLESTPRYKQVLRFYSFIPSLKIIWMTNHICFQTIYYLFLHLKIS